MTIQEGFKTGEQEPFFTTRPGPAGAVDLYTLPGGRVLLDAVLPYFNPLVETLADHGILPWSAGKKNVSYEAAIPVDVAEKVIAAFGGRK